MRPFKHFGALKNGNGFGIAIDDLSEEETEEINRCLRNLKRNIRGVKLHPNFYPRNGKMLSAWVIPAEYEAIKPMLDIIDEHGFKRNKSADNLIAQLEEDEKERQKEQEINAELSVAHSGPEFHVPGLVGELRNYQRGAVDWILRNRRVYVGDEMGTGKTLSSLAAIAIDNAYPVLVVCPASVKIGWQRQIAEFFPDLAPHTYVCHGKRAVPFPEGTKIVVINYDILANWIHSIYDAKFKAVIYDEAHFIKNKRSLRTRAAAAAATGTDIRIAMSGTPVTSRPIDLMSQLSAIGRLNDLTGGRSWAYIERYCSPTHNGYGWNTRGASNLFELNRRLRRLGILIRRRKEDVLSELPPKERISIPVDISNRTDYSRVRDDIAYWVTSQIQSDEKIRAAIADMSEDEAQEFVRAEITSKIARAQSAIAITKLNALRQICARGKTKAALDWIEEFLTSEEKLVVFCSHREAVDAVCAKLGDRAVRVVGGMGANAKQAAIDKFVNDPDVRVVVANIDAAAEGIDGWQHVCSNVAFLELTWTPTKHHQAEDRCHRSGQNNPVSCYYLLATNTIDEYLASLIDNKHAVVSAVIDGVTVDQSDTILADLLNRLSNGEF